MTFRLVLLKDGVEVEAAEDNQEISRMCGRIRSRVQAGAPLDFNDGRARWGEIKAAAAARGIEWRDVRNQRRRERYWRDKGAKNPNAI